MQEFSIKDVKYKPGGISASQHEKHQIPCKLYLLDGLKSLNTALRCRDAFLSFFNFLNGKSPYLHSEFDKKGFKSIRNPKLLIVFNDVDSAYYIDEGLELIKEFFDYTKQKLSYRRIGKKTIVFNFESVKDINILTFDYIIATLRQTFPDLFSRDNWNDFQNTYKDHELIFNNRIHKQ